MSKIFILVLSILLIWSCSNNKDNIIYGSGTIEATEVVVSAVSVGQILRLYAEEGITVKAGDTLAVIDYEKLTIQRAMNLAQLKEIDISTAIAQKNKQNAELHYENQKKKYARIQALLAQESATQQQFDDIQTAYEIAATQLKAAVNQLDLVQAKREQLMAANDLLAVQIKDATVLAPLTGTILKKYHEQGEFVAAGISLYRIADLSRMSVTVYISEAQLGKVNLNQKASILVDSYPEAPFIGKVTWISSKAEFTPKNVQTQEARLNLVYAVKIAMANAEFKLKIGMPADVEIEL